MFETSCLNRHQLTEEEERKKEKKKIVEVYWHDRKASYILHSRTSKRSQVTCVIHSHGMDKIVKKMVMNLKCKYRPKRNIHITGIQADLRSM
jgi:hypothetical protein